MERNHAVEVETKSEPECKDKSKNSSKCQIEQIEKEAQDHHR